MNTDKLISIVGLILALSIASERLVEIVKGYIPWLNTAAATNEGDGRRRATLQLMAVLAGVTTAWLSRDYIPTEISDVAHGWSFLGLGLLASGGSGFWNAILSYVLKVKDLKGLEAKAMEGAVKAGATAPGPAQKPSGAPLAGGPGLVGAT